MWNRAPRGIVAAAAVTAIVVAVAMPALAQVTPPGEEPAPAGFEERRTTLLERIDDRVDALAERRALLESTAERLDGFAAGVAAATTPEELRAAVQAAREDLAGIREAAKQVGYARLVDHVGDDVAKFTARADRLAGAIESAAGSGIDTSAASAELDDAFADIGAAADVLATLPPDAGDDVDEFMPLARDAHATVHEGQAHLRAAFAMLRDAVGAIRLAPSGAMAF